VSAPRAGKEHGGAIPTIDRAVGQRDPPRFLMLKRVTLAAATAFLAINVWTGAPLLALWAGSQVEGETSLTMRALLVVIAVLIVLVAVMTTALTWLSNTYDQLMGRPLTERRRPWLRSMRAEAEIHVSSRVGITALERIVMMSVYIAVITLLVWLIFFAGSSVPPQLRG